MPRKSKKEIEQEKLAKQSSHKLFWIIMCLLMITLIFFSLAHMGPFGTLMNNVLSFLLGTVYIIPLLTLFSYAIYIVFFSARLGRSLKTAIGLFSFNILVLLLTAFIGNTVNTFPELLDYLENFFKLFSGELCFVDANGSLLIQGGLFANLLYVIIISLVERSGAAITLAVLFIISLILLIPFDTYTNAYNDIKENRAIAKQGRQARKQEEQLEKERLEEERKLQLAQEMNAAPEFDQQVIDIQADEVKEEIVEEEKPVDTYSTNSPFLINLTSDEIGHTVSSKKSATKNKSASSTFDSNEEEESEHAPRILKVKRNSGRYVLPKPLDQFLEASTSNSSNINKTSAAVKGEKVIEILRNFGIESTLVNTYIGPSVTKFEIKPDSNVKINKINNISDNIKMELAARDIRIEAPIPGRSAVGIEIPNVEPVPVKMLDLMKSIPSDKKNEALLFALGKDLMGKAVYCDITKMPHLLIAGATGSGKSVCINSIISSLLLRTNPDDVKMVLVDPKKVEFTPYKDIPHLLWPIIDDATMASNMLKKIVVMMEDRYELFAEVGVRNITAYNEAVVENNNAGNEPMNKLPYIVVIIDELADLMMVAGKDVELSIQRITQLARASGIHLVVATQRPSTDVITGLIKSNIPSRISFAVASSIDSRTILDATGAERLLGNGDMLYHPQGENAPMRLQGVYVTDKEISKITKYVKNQAQPQYEDSYFEFLTNMNGTTVAKAGSVNADSMDSLYDEVVEFVRSSQKASTSLLQRRFGIGYNRAARLIDTLEDRGIIGPANGSKAREVYVKADEE